jgi:hypothetical protein
MAAVFLLIFAAGTTVANPEHSSGIASEQINIKIDFVKLGYTYVQVVSCSSQVKEKINKSNGEARAASIKEQILECLAAQYSPQKVKEMEQKKASEEKLTEERKEQKIDEMIKDESEKIINQTESINQKIRTFGNARINQEVHDFNVEANRTRTQAAIIKANSSLVEQRIKLMEKKTRLEIAKINGQMQIIIDKNNDEAAKTIKKLEASIREEHEKQLENTKSNDDISLIIISINDDSSSDPNKNSSQNNGNYTSNQ